MRLIYSICLLFSFMLCSVFGDLILAHDNPSNDIIFDKNANQYWLASMFYRHPEVDEIFPETGTFEDLEFITTKMNYDREMISKNWGEWHIADESEINELLKNDLEDFLLFEESDVMGDFRHAGFFDKRDPDNPNKIAHLEVVVPHYPDDHYPLPLPDPSYNITYENNQYYYLGHTSAWITADGKSNSEIPEPSMTLPFVSAMVSIIIWANRKNSI